MLSGENIRFEYCCLVGTCHKIFVYLRMAQLYTVGHDLGCMIWYTHLLRLIWPTNEHVCQKQLSRAGASNYIPQILWDVITCPCLRYLHLAHQSSNEDRWISESWWSNWTLNIKRYTASVPEVTNKKGVIQIDFVKCLVFQICMFSLVLLVNQWSS